MYPFENIRIISESDNLEYKEKHPNSVLGIYPAYLDGEPFVPVTKNWFYNWAGSLKLGLYNGEKLLHVGDLSGITDEMRENWRNYIGKVAEISCMEISEDKDGKKGFRHPKLIAIRDDKKPIECTIDQIQ